MLGNLIGEKERNRTHEVSVASYPYRLRGALWPRRWDLWIWHHILLGTQLKAMAGEIDQNHRVDDLTLKAEHGGSRIGAINHISHDSLNSWFGGIDPCQCLDVPAGVRIFKRLLKKSAIVRRPGTKIITGAFVIGSK